MDCVDEEKFEDNNVTNRVTLNKTFAKNILKQVGDHNRIKSDIQSLNHRKFENDLRKKHTLKNLESFSSSQTHKTMYSDYYDFESSSSSKKPKKSHITPFEQVQKLVSDAAAFDRAIAEQQKDRIIVKKKAVFGNRISLDKTLLHNHLKHTNVHNRLKEEEEMWDQHALQKTRKIKSLQSKSSRERQKRSGSMYSDLEVNKVKPLRVKSTGGSSGSFGKWTKKLLEEKEKDPNKWGHSGFQALYHDELVGNDQRTVNVSDDDSDDEEVSPRKPSNVRRRIVKVTETSVDGNGLKRPKNIRSAKSIIIRTLQNRNSTNGKAPKRKLSHGLHADAEATDEEGNYRKMKRFEEVKKPKNKWSHDRYHEVNNDEERKKSKSLLISEDSEDERTEKTNGSKEWKSRCVVTKKSVVKVARGDVDDNTVNRVTLRNSIHEESSEKPGKRLVLSKKKITSKKQRDVSSDTDSSTESSGKEVDKKSKKRKTINRKRIVKRKRKLSTTSSSSE